MARLRLRYYRRGRLELGPVALEVYRLEREEEVEGDLVEVFGDVSERFRESPEYAVLVEDPSTGRRAVYTSYREGVLMFQEPARLLRVSLIGDETLQPGGSLASYSAPEPVYVYVGRIAVSKKDVYGVLLETDKGKRFIRLRGDEERLQ